MKSVLAAISLFFIVSLFVFQDSFANGQAKTLGNVNAPQGGTFYLSMSSEPQTLNPLTSTDVYAQQLHAYVMDGLMTMDIDKYEYVPGLAHKVEKDPKGMWYIFHIRKDAKWHDGKPLTAQDVKFSYDAIMDSRFDTAHARPYFENIKDCEIIDDYTVKFNIKKKYFNNFNVLASGGFMTIVPKHIYGDPKKKNNKILIGSGPYILHKYNRGKSIILKRNKKWWGNKLAHLKGAFNWDKLFFRFIKDENVRMEMLKKGKIDFQELTPEAYMKKTTGKVWKTKLEKKKVIHDGPKGYGFVAWNFKKKMFQDKKVRIALAHAMNRELMNKKFRFNMSLLATGPWYQQSPYANKEVKPIPFDPKKAQKLFKEAGWTDSDKDGVLDKKIDGKLTPFKFTLLLASRDGEKYQTVYKEDLKKLGVDMTIKLIEWNSFVKALDERKFEAVSLGWGGGSVDNDPKQIWHSDSSKAGGSNFNSYSNKEVDKLIMQGRAELDKQKRIKIYQKIYKLIADDAPYAFMFNNKFYLYGKNKKAKSLKDTYKYDIGTMYWWSAEAK